MRWLVERKWLVISQAAIWVWFGILLMVMNSADAGRGRDFVCESHQWIKEMNSGRVSRCENEEVICYLVGGVAETSISCVKK